MESFVCKVTAATPTTTSPSVTLFDSQGLGETWLRNSNVQRLIFRVMNSAAGTLTLSSAVQNGSYSTYATQAVAASSAVVQVFDFDVAPFSNAKLAFTSVTTAEQTVWTPEIMLTTDRHTGT
jgi:hypothetical protein